jgi:hypothetical protein
MAQKIEKSLWTKLHEKSQGTRPGNKKDKVNTTQNKRNHSFNSTHFTESLRSVASKIMRQTAIEVRAHHLDLG